MNFEQIIDFLARLFVIGGVSVGVFWVVFQKAVERWVDGHFAKRQKEFEHELAKDLQRLKVKMDTVIQGALRLQEREFKLLPEAWEKISEAFGLTMWLAAPFQQFPSVQGLTESELDEYLSKSDYLESQKEKIKGADWREQNKIVQQIEVRKRRVKVHNAIAEADKFIKVNGVFLPLDILKQLTDLKDKTWSCLVAHEVGTDHDNYKMVNEGWQKLKDEGEPLHNAVEMAIRTRLSDQARLVEDVQKT